MEKVTLPVDFDGDFYFTNWTDEEFIGKWNGKAYKFPAKKTSKMLILDATPIEVQHIRKKFAKELAEQEFFKGQKYESLRSPEGQKDENGVLKPLMGSFRIARSYTENDLKDMIQKCLDPLPIARITVVEEPKEKVETKLTLNQRGKRNSSVVETMADLKDADEGFAVK